MTTFPVMLANAPFVYYKSKGAGQLPAGKYPGDPTPLLFATNLAVREASRGGFDSFGWVPGFGGGIYNPVIWNQDIRDDLIQQLAAKPPVVFAVSGTSPAWPFLRQIVQEVRAHTDALTIVGGPHMDEMWTEQGKIHPAHPLNVSPQIFEITVSGDGQQAFLLLLQTVAESLAQTNGRLDKNLLRMLLMQKESEIAALPGKALIAFEKAGGGLVTLTTSGRRLGLEDFGSPYEHFPPQARFPIFGNELTAHLMSTFGCMFNCAFCSERGNLIFERRNVVNYTVSQIRTARKWGANHFFFDDSILMAGAWNTIEQFASRLLSYSWRIKWAGQLTVHNLTPKGQFANKNFGKFAEKQIKHTLQLMRESGFSYLYIGLESAAESVMQHIDKAKHLHGRWQASVETALQLVKDVGGIQVGTSIMFGNAGETQKTIDETIDFVKYLVDKGLLDYVSMNLATYHPDTPLARADGVAQKLRYDTRPSHPGVLYELFEEADRGRVSGRMSEELMLHVLNRVPQAWGNALTSIEKIKQVVRYGYPSLQFCEV